MTQAHLPPEMIYQIMLELPYTELITYCGTSAQTYGICEDDAFWHDRYLRDYPTVPTTRIYSWRQAYHDRKQGVYVAYERNGELPMS